MTPIFQGKFKDQQDVFEWFNLKDTQTKGVKIVFACRDNDQRSYGRLYVVFTKGNEIFEIFAAYNKYSGTNSTLWRPTVLTHTQLKYRHNYDDLIIPREYKPSFISTVRDIKFVDGVMCDESIVLLGLL